MTFDEIKKRKAPIVIIDKALDKFNNIVLFPDKLEKANEMLKTIGLPKLGTHKTLKNGLSPNRNWQNINLKVMHIK